MAAFVTSSRNSMTAIPISLLKGALPDPTPIVAIGTARARQPRALDLNGGLSLNLPLAIGLLYDRTWSAAAPNKFTEASSGAAYYG